MADPAMIRQVLDSLLDNALGKPPPGQTARVDITAAAHPARPGWVQIEVADRGVGIPDAHKRRVFDPFHRVSAGHMGVENAGSGLGPAICRRIVERHGGVITLTDNPGGGTRIQFTLPVAVEPDPPSGEAPQALASGS